MPQYLNDEELRQTIQAATHKSESFNRVAKWLALAEKSSLPPITAMNKAS
ncbi:MAG: transposase [Cyanobacteria bacterium CRU_2_1]|nr:transposase [Cyanobacteria bacterium CRU_2_1]